MNKNNTTTNKIIEENIKVFRGLVLEFKSMEDNLKYFNAERAVTDFMSSEFYVPTMEYKNVKAKCREYIIDMCADL